VRAFANLYRELDAATATKSKQAALTSYFAAARADPARWGSAAWAAYFLSGGKPRQIVPTRVLGRLGIEGGGVPEWLFEECYQSVGDLAETLSLLLPEGQGGADVPLDVWMQDRLLPLRALDEEEKFTRLRDWTAELEVDERFALFKLITGAFRVGVSRLQVVKALAQVANVEESRMAQRMMGAGNAGGGRFRRADRRGRRRRGQGARRGQALSVLSRAFLGASGRGHGADAGASIGLDRRMEVRRHPRAVPQPRERLASVVARRGTDLRRLS
jgi:hypothetical protein